MTKEQLTEYIERVIRPRMSTVEGVADVQIFGAQEYSMRVWIDPVKLAARGVTASDVLTAINNSNFLSAPGNTQNEYVVSSITVRSTLQTPEAFARAAAALDRRQCGAPARRGSRRTRRREHRHQGQLQRQARCLPRHLPDPGGKSADHGGGAHQSSCRRFRRRCRKA